MTDLSNAFRKWQATEYGPLLAAFCGTEGIRRLDARVAKVAEEIASEAFAAAWSAASNAEAELHEAFRSWVRNDKPAILRSSCAGVHLHGLDSARIKVLGAITRVAFCEGWEARRRMAQIQGNQGDLFGGGG